MTNAVKWPRDETRIAATTQNIHLIVSTEIPVRSDRIVHSRRRHSSLLICKSASVLRPLLPFKIKRESDELNTTKKKRRKATKMDRTATRRSDRNVCEYPARAGPPDRQMNVPRRKRTRATTATQTRRTGKIYNKPKPP